MEDIIYENHSDRITTMSGMSTIENSVQVRVEIGFRGGKSARYFSPISGKAVDSATNWPKPPVQCTLSNPTTFLEIQDACLQDIQMQQLEDECILVGQTTNCSIYLLRFIREGVSVPGKKFKSKGTKGNAW